MDLIGILVYGYGETEAAGLRDALSIALGRDIVLLSASGMEDATLYDAIQKANSTFFEEKDTVLLIFLDFTDEEIRKTLSSFPGGQARRPIFCSPTKENIKWPLRNLIGHLEEEDRYWKEKRKKN